jgi:small subunit ribosomal protein S3
MVAERKLITENIRRVLLKEYIMKETEKAGFGGLDIQRTPMGTRIKLVAERPGMIIGQRGQSIKDLTEVVENRFKFDNPQIEVEEDRNPNLNPLIMAQKLASAIERGWHFRRAGHSTVRRIMESGAKGCQVVISGKLTGERHRTEKFREGHIKYCGEPKMLFMKIGYAVAKKKPGIIGIKVMIMWPDAHLPDEIKVKDPASAAAAVPPAPAPPAEGEPKPEGAEAKKDDKKAEPKAEAKPEEKKVDEKREDKKADKKELDKKEASKPEKKEEPADKGAEAKAPPKGA